MKTKVAVTLVALLLVLAIVLFCQIFNLSTIDVVFDGASNQMKQQVTKNSGIELHTSIFSLSKDAVKKNLESADATLVVDRVEKVFPNTVRLYVRERKPIVVVALMDNSGVVATDRDFQLGKISNDADIDYNTVIRVSGTSISNSFDTNELVYLRRVIYAFLRVGFNDDSLVQFIKEFRFTADGLHVILRTEQNSEIFIKNSNVSYEVVTTAVQGAYARFLETPEKERSNKVFAS